MRPPFPPEPRGPFSDTASDADGSWDLGALPTAARGLEAGDRLSLRPGLDVRVEGLLGQGGMGVVYQVLDERLSRSAALKLMLEPGGTRTQRFARERKITARLDHPGVPAVYEAGRTPRGEDYLLMRFVAGRPLLAALREVHADALPSLESLRPLLADLARVCEVVAFAHSRRIVHRDLKPANVMVGSYGEVFVVDWGLARDLEQSADEDARLRANLGPTKGPGRLTRDGAFVGTIGFLPPEQARGEDVDARADVFALGAILSAILTGAPPLLPGSTPLAQLELVGDGQVIFPEERRPDLPRELNAIAARALDPEAAGRYPSAAELGADLRAYLERRSVAAYSYGPLERALRWVRDHPTWLAGLTAASLVSLPAFLALSEVRQRSADEARGRLVEVARRASHEAERTLAAAAGAEARSRMALALRALAAAQRWSSLAPEDPQAAREAYDAALALGGEALAQQQWALARAAYAEAAALGVDDARAQALIEETELAASEEERQRSSELEALLAQAEAGELAQRPRGVADAVFEAVREPSPATRGLLATRLEGIGARLRGIRDQVYLEANELIPPERARGEEPLAGLPAALAAWGAGTHPGLDVLAQAERRLAARAGELPRHHPPRLVVNALVGRRQREQLGPGPLDAARLCCEALGRLERHEQSVMALAAYLAAEGDEGRALPAALALARLGGRDALDRVHAARRRFGPSGSLFAAQVARAVRGRSEPPSAVADRAGDLLRRADELRVEGELIAARRDLERALELAPDDPRAWDQLGDVCEQLGDLEGALHAYSRAVELAPQDAIIRCNRAAACLALGDPRTAAEEATRALELDPLLVGAWNNRGIARGELGDLPGSIADHDRAIALDPGEILGWANRAAARLRSGDAAGALSDSTRALELDPGQPGVWTNRGMAQLRLGSPRRAVTDLSRALELDPECAPAWVARSKARRALGDLPAAEADARRAAELAPHEGRAQFELGMVLAERGDARGATAALSRAVELNPRLGEAWLERGILRRLARDLAGAVEDLSRAAQLDPRNPRGWSERGATYLEGELPEQAVADFRRALELDPGHAGLLANLGSALRALGRLDEALEALDRALERDPHQVGARLARAEVHRARGAPLAALADFEAAIAAAPDEPQAWGKRAAFRQSEGDLEGALADLDRALTLDPRYAAAYAMRGIVHERLDRRDAAIRDYRRSLELEPRGPAARACRAQLARLGVDATAR